MFFRPHFFRAGATTAAGGESFDFYISTTGTGTASGGGTFADPWPISMLNDTTARARYAGNSIGVMDGTYNLIDIFGQHSGTFDTGILKVYNTSGSEGSRTILKAVNRHQAIINFQRDAMTNTDESAALQPAGDYVTVDGLKIINCNYRCITNYAGGGDYFTVQNCWFEDQVFSEVTGSGKNSGMVFMQGYVGCKNRNNYYTLGGAPGDSDRHQMIEHYDCQNMTVEYNTLLVNDGTITGGKAGGYYSKMTDNNNVTVRYNFIDCRPAANSCVLMDTGGDASGNTYIHHNVLLTNTGSGEGSFLRVIYSNGDTLHFYNNTCAGGRADPGAVHNMDFGAPDFSSYENIIAPISGYGFAGTYDMSNITQFQTLDYNLYDSSPAPSISGTGGGSGLATMQANTGKETNSATTADPMYTGTGSGAQPWQLQSGSPGKDMGPGGTEIGAWSSNNSGPDQYGPGYSASRS